MPVPLWDLRGKRENFVAGWSRRIARVHSAIGDEYLTMGICAIHQPNFFPWIGYFDKIKRVDTFVFLDQVNYPKSGNSMGSFCNRVKIIIDGKPDWISCPVIRESGVQSIDAVKIDGKRPWKEKFRKVIEANYRTAANFPSVFELVEKVLGFETEFLAEFNINAITVLADHLGYRAKFVRQSDLPSMQETSTARLVELTKAVGATTYFSGGGAAGYQENAAFVDADLRIVYQDFKIFPYGNPSAFVPGLSVLDWLMRMDEKDREGLTLCAG